MGAATLNTLVVVLDDHVDASNVRIYTSNDLANVRVAVTYANEPRCVDVATTQRDPTFVSRVCEYLRLDLVISSILRGIPARAQLAVEALDTPFQNFPAAVSALGEIEALAREARLELEGMEISRGQSFEAEEKPIRVHDEQNIGPGARVAVAAG